MIKCDMEQIGMDFGSIANT